MTSGERKVSGRPMADAVEPPTKQKLVGAVVQAVRILQALDASSRALGVSALAREAKVNPSTAFNILRTLVVEELVTFDEPSKTYSLGNGLLRLSRKLIGQNLLNEIRPELGSVASETACLVGFWQVAGDRMILVERALADRPMRLDMAVRNSLPVMLGAVGRAYAASRSLKDSELKAAFKQLRWDGEIDASRYIDEVRAAEKVRYGVDRGTLYGGVVSIGAVITNSDGAPIYGVTASDMESKFDEGRIDRVGRSIASLAQAFSERS